VTDELNGAHRPLKITYAANVPSSPKLPKRAYWRLNSANANNFKRALENKFQNFIDEHKSKTPEETLIELTRRTIETAITNVGKAKSSNDPKNNPWWNQTIASLIKQKKRARRKSQKQRTPENKAKYDELQKRTKRAIRKAKAEHDEKKYQRRAQKSPSAVWEQFKRDTNPTYIPITIRKQNGDLTNDPEKTAELIRDTFDRTSKGQDCEEDNGHQKLVQEYLTSHKSDYEPTTMPNEHYNKLFNIEELKEAIQQAKEGAPGHDEIHYWFLKNSGINFKTALLQTINKFWENGKMPTAWKTAHVIPIPKPKKDKTNPANYRPISLLSCAAKTMERMIKNRLYWQAETNKWLSPHQSAFRRDRNTTDALLNLIEEGYEAIRKREEVLAVFLDIKKAYDTVWHDGLIYKLHQKGLRGRMLHYINNFLRERICVVKLQGIQSNPYFPTAGVPQGSVLSTLLFNIYVNDATKIPSPHTSIELFADDVTLWTRCQSRKQGTNEMNKTLEELNNWAKKWRLTFSETKSSYMVLSRRTRTPDWQHGPILNKRPLIQKKTQKLLGITLDSKLRWTEHINTTQQSGNRKLNILKRFAGGTFTRRTNLRTLYLGFIRPTLEYASACWTSAPKSQLAKLERIQNHALRLITGAALSTPIIVLQTDTNIPPLRLRWDQNLLRTVFRNQRDDSITISRKLIRQSQDGPYESPSTRAGKLIQRLFQNDIPNCAGVPPPVPPLPPIINADQTTTKAYETLFREATKILCKEWQTKYTESTKGEYYKRIRPKIHPTWPHTNLETYRLSRAIFRIRSGHNNLATHNKTTEQTKCDECNTDDSAEHLLFECQKFDAKRKILFETIRNETRQRVPITMNLLLGRPNEFQTNETLQKIATNVAKYIMNTRRNL